MIGKLSLRMSGWFTAWQLGFFLSCGSVSGAPQLDSRSAWDLGLSSMSFRAVRIQAGSMEEAWKYIGSHLMLRTVLAVSARDSTSGPFSLERENCTGAELLDELVRAYPSYTWTHDERTSVIWIHPSAIPLADLLPQIITVERDSPGLPMQKAILEPLSRLYPSAISVKRWGTAFANTLNYPVDIPRGVYTIRDVLNRCCMANPTKTFHVSFISSGAVHVTAVNLVTDGLAHSPVGALSLWEIEIGKLNDKEPSDQQVIDALAHANPRVRWAARIYLEANAWRIPSDRWIADTADPEKALWVALAFCSVRVRTEEATCTACIARMKREFSDELFAKAPPGLALLLACEMARVAKDARGLALVTKRHFTESEVAPTISELTWMLRVSKPLREALANLGPSWPHLSMESLQALEDEKSAPFSTQVLAP